MFSRFFLLLHFTWLLPFYFLTTFFYYARLLVCLDLLLFYANFPMYYLCASFVRSFIRLCLFMATCLVLSFFWTDFRCLYVVVCIAQTRAMYFKSREPARWKKRREREKCGCVSVCLFTYSHIYSLCLSQLSHLDARKEKRALIFDCHYQKGESAGSLPLDGLLERSIHPSDSNWAHFLTFLISQSSSSSEWANEILTGNQICVGVWMRWKVKQAVKCSCE